MKQINQIKPLVANIANIVTANQCANALLAIGASPVMSQEITDLKQLIGFSKSFVINIGTAKESDVPLILEAVKHAKQLEIPVILDPVGSGATTFRTSLSREIANLGATIIKGNLSEVLSLKYEANTKGVDSNEKTIELEKLKEISKEYNSILLVTGEVDYIVENDELIEVKGGNSKMTLKTGMGCMSASLLGAFSSVFESKDACVELSKMMKQLGSELFIEKIPSYNEICNWIYDYEK